MPDIVHALFSPSKLPRIIQCPGSVFLTNGMQQKETSKYAAEGTFLHSIVEDHLTRDEYKILAPLHEDPAVNADYTDAVSTILDFVFTMKAKHTGKEWMEYIEERVSLKRFCAELDNDLLADVEGTADWIFSVDQTLYVCDWKFGKGIKVEPDSDQLKAYAAGALRSSEHAKLYTKVVCIIGQPRISDNAFTEIEYSVHDILRWVKFVLSPALLATKASEPILRPSPSACRWCLANMTCRARHAGAHEAAAAIFEAATKLPDKVTKEELAKILAMIPTWDTYVKDLTTFALNELQSGRGIPGYKLVRGRANRTWKNDETTVAELELRGIDASEVSVIKLLSPAQVEKKFKNLKKEAYFADLIFKPEGNLTLTTEDDIRPAVKCQTAEEIFTALINQED